jgi:hypothetical protein
LIAQELNSVRFWLDQKRSVLIQASSSPTPKEKGQRSSCSRLRKSGLHTSVVISVKDPEPNDHRRQHEDGEDQDEKCGILGPA